MPERTQNGLGRAVVSASRLAGASETASALRGALFAGRQRAKHMHRILAVHVPPLQVLIQVPARNLDREVAGAIIHSLHNRPARHNQFEPNQHQAIEYSADLQSSAKIYGHLPGRGWSGSCTRVLLPAHILRRLTTLGAGPEEKSYNGDPCFPKTLNPKPYTRNLHPKP